ncbi:cytochrome P450 [Salinisphaera dokdonensis]|uniref:cytochrome P450 n=1 Tax=Salinisphaera dokdonensis TaxID=454598 RepID=UPI00333F96AC
MVASIVAAREASGTQAFDFLGHLLAAHPKNAPAESAGMTRDELIDEVMTLIVAGHETTASALAWAWYEIATHPRVLERLLAAVDALDAGEIAQFCARPGARLTFVDAVIREVLRLYPPGWLLSRRALVPDRLGDHDIEAGDQLFISPYVLHRHADYWQAPETFAPARFLASGTPGHRFAFLPFAAGPRHCVGEQMAMTEMRAQLVTTLRRLRPVYAGNRAPRLESRINLRPGAGGVPLRWVRR